MTCTGGTECTKCSDERIKDYARKIIEKYTINFHITGKCRRMTEALEAERQIQKGGKRMNQIQAFNFNSSEIRVVRGTDGEPWFVAKDVCDVLEIMNVSDTVSKVLDEDERGIDTIYTLGGEQQVSVINESGLYSLVLRSRKPEAKKFKKWVTSEVLPSIRKHGGYLTPEKIEEAILNPDTIIRLATTLKFERQQRALAEAQRDEAIRTKAWIGTKREATAMATAAAEKRRAEALAEQVGDSTNWKSVKSLRWLLDVFADSKGMWSAVGKRLKSISDEMGYEVRQIEHSDYGHVNAYHRNVIDRFQARVIADQNMLGKYRREELEASA